MPSDNQDIKGATPLSQRFLSGSGESYQQTSSTNDLPSFSLSSAELSNVSQVDLVVPITDNHGNHHIIKKIFLFLFILVFLGGLVFWLLRGGVNIVTNLLNNNKNNTYRSNPKGVVNQIDKSKPYIELKLDSSAGLKKGEQINVKVNMGTAGKSLLGYDLVVYCEQGYFEVNKDAVKSMIGGMNIFKQVNNKTGQLAITATLDTVGNNIVLDNDIALEVPITVVKDIDRSVRIVILKEGDGGELTQMMFAGGGEYPEKIIPQLSRLDLGKN